MRKFVSPLIFVISTVYGSYQARNYDIRQIEPSNSTEDALAKVSLKRNILLDKWSQRPMDKFPFKHTFESKELNSITAAYARVVTKTDIESVNDYLLDERFEPALVGTRIKLFGGLCKRYGDYDFVLQELVRIAYHGKGVISDAAYERLLNELLSQKGNKHYTHFAMGVCGRKIKDTENHVLMTEVARYLTNQLMLDETGDEIYDNEKNGFNTWMIDHLEYFFKHGFSEINSKPYAGYTIQTLLNLYDYARDERVKRSSQILLDYLAMKFAMESSQGRRYPTFRRQYRRYLDERIDEADYMSAAMMIWAGQYDYLNHSDIDLSQSTLPYGDRIALNISLSTYRPHPYVYEHLFNPAESLQFYDFDHKGMQVVYKNPQYVISGGGVHRRLFPPFSMLNDVLAAPTMIIPNKKGRLLSEMIYFLGYNKEKKRSNLCVNKNFMCGFNLHIPKSFEQCLVDVTYEWSFYDFTQEKCSDSPYAGLKMAVYKRNIKHRIHRKTKGKNFGLVEVSNDDKSMMDFMIKILHKNPRRFKRGKVTYTMSTGDELEVNLDPSKGQYNFDYIENRVKNYDRVRGTFHKMNDEVMTLISPSGEVDKIYYRDNN